MVDTARPRIVQRRAPRPPPSLSRARKYIRSTLDDGLTMAQEIFQDPTLLLWALYILLTPVYLWSNGLPQVGDILVLLLAPIVLAKWNRRLPRGHQKLVRPLAAFTIYVFVVNVFWTVALGAYSFALKTGFGLSPLFYLYNGLVFLVALVMAQRHGERFIRHTVRLVALSVVLQMLISFVKAGNSNRGTVLFNNPNQLGYYAALSAVIILVGQRRAKLSPMATSISLLASLYLALLSASKAALACIVLVVVIGMIDRLRTILVTALVGSVLLVFTSNPVSDLFDRATERVQREEKLGFLEGRGYDRIVEQPEHLLFGAGEGAYYRYKTESQGTHELHSSIGTLVFCYGLVGTVLFGLFIFRMFGGAPWRRMALLAPAFAYGLSHQGLRFTLVWMLFALYVALKTPTGPPGPANLRT